MADVISVNPDAHKGANIMEIRTYSDRSNARRAARSRGLDPDSHIFPCEEGFEVRFAEAAETALASVKRPIDGLDIPEFLKRPPMTEDEKAQLDAKTRRASNPQREIVMPKTKPKPAPTPKGDKNATLLQMLSGKGATVEQLTKSLEWLPHTLRARISRLGKPKSKGGEGLKIERSRTDGVTSYRIA